MLKELKVAIVHDWFTVDGGAEKVCRELINVFPDAEIFSLIDFLNDEDRENILRGKRSNTSVIQKFPLAKRFYRYYLPWFPYAIEQLNLEKYDLIISSSYAVSKGVLSNANQVHISYCHSPMRYLWDLYFSYIGQTKWYNFPIKFLMRHYISQLRQWDVISSNRVDFFIANSKNIANRIQKVYRRDATVIYPPIETDRFKLVEEKSDYYITASRLVPYKKVDLIVKTFKELPNKKLKVIGDGPELSKLKKLAKGCPNIEILGYVPKNKFVSTLSKAKAFINASNEDFGIAPLEAQACGIPVIAFAKGGILETTIENKTAIYFHEQSINSIIKSISKFEQSNLLSAEEIRAFTLTFNSERFRTEISNFVMKCLEEKS